MGIKLIGIAGKARSGKDAFASTLVDEHGFIRMAFADPLKLATCAAFGWSYDRMFGDPDFKNYRCPIWGLTVRDALQRMGTEAVKGTFGESFWIVRWAIDYARVKEISSVVITDVRTDHEAAALRSEGALIVHLQRKGAGLKGAEGQHASEQGVSFDSRTDIHMDNDGTLDELADKAHRVVAFIEQNFAQFNLKNIQGK